MIQGDEDKNAAIHATEADDELRAVHVRFDEDYNVLDDAGKPKPYTAEQQVQLLKLLLRHSMAYQAFDHHRRFADIINDDEGLRRKEAKYGEVVMELRELIGRFDRDEA